MCLLNRYQDRNLPSTDREETLGKGKMRHIILHVSAERGGRNIHQRQLKEVVF
jgi:hypothetical protein